jgi:hypothetical protein
VADLVYAVVDASLRIERMAEAIAPDPGPGKLAFVAVRPLATHLARAPRGLVERDLPQPYGHRCPE